MAGLWSGIVAFPGHTHLLFEEKLNKFHKCVYFSNFFSSFKILCKLPSTVKPVISSWSKRPKIGFQDRLSLNEGLKNCRMLQGEHFAILLTCIKLPFVIEIFVLSIFE